MAVAEAVGKTVNTSFLVDLWSDLTVAMKIIPEMFLSVTFGGILSTVDLLPPTVPPKIKPR